MQHDNELTAEQVRANLHLLTLPELLAGVTPLLVVRGKTAGSSVLVLGRDAHFVLDPVVGAHVMRFADYADFRAKEAKIREQVRGKVIVETEFFVAPAKAPMAERPAPVPVAVDLEKQAKEAATMRWNARWSEREGVLARTLEPTLVQMMAELDLPPDRYCGKRKMMERILTREKTRALEQMAFAGDMLPAVPEAQEFEDLAAANRDSAVTAGVIASEVDTPAKYAEAMGREAANDVPSVIEPAAGMGAALADNAALWQTMPLAQLRELAASRGIQKTDRRDIIRALTKAQPVAA